MKNRAWRLLFVIALIVLGMGLSANAFANGFDFVSEFNTGDFALGIKVVNGTAYIAAYGSGLITVDVSDPYNPTLLGQYDESNYAMDVDVVEDSAFVAWYANGLRVVDVSNPQNPNLVGSCSVPDHANDVVVKDGYAYVAAQYGGLRIIDVSMNPSIEIGAFHDAVSSDNNKSNVFVDGNYVYAIGGHGKGLVILDVSNPNAPDSVGGIAGDYSGIVVRDGYAYMNTNPMDNNNEFYVCDVSDPTNPVLVGNCQLLTDGHNGDSYLFGNYVYIACQTTGLEVIDISDPLNPVNIGNCDDYGFVRDVFVDKNYIYLATSEHGLVILETPQCAGSTFGMLGFSTYVSGTAEGVGGVITPDGLYRDTLFNISTGWLDWSEDLTKVIFHSCDTVTGRWEIFIANADGSDIVQITHVNDHWGQSSPRFRNGTKVWFTMSLGTGHSELAEINYDGSGLRQLSNFYGQGRQITQFDLWEDKIVYVTQRSSWSPTGEVFVANITTDGSGQEIVDWGSAVQLTHDNQSDGSPNISPDGTKIVFHRNDGSAGYGPPYNLIVMDIDGGNQHYITHSTNSNMNYYSPVFSPDGIKVACTSNNGQADIVVMNVDGSDMTNITNTPEMNEVCTTWRIFDCLPNYGTIAGVVSCDGNGLLGVPIVVTDGDGAVVASTVSDENGSYEFVDISNGEYAVSISTPLGYQTTEESKPVTVNGQNYTINFALTKPEIVSDIRTRCYWAYQMYMASLGRTKDYTPDEIAQFAGLMAEHFNSNQMNPVDYYNVPQPATQVDSLTVLKRMLYMQSDEPTEYKLLKARAQLMTLLLNVVSGKISQTEAISKDEKTVSQAITYCDMLIGDEIDVYEPYGAWFDYNYPLYRYVMAGYILTLINNAYPISTGMIPDIANIAYRELLDPAIPEAFVLSQNYPNPFNPTTSISYSLPEQSDVTLAIFNIAGQKVRTLVSGPQEAGEHSVIWDGKDVSGQTVASGIYFYKITAGQYTDTKKMVLLK